MALVVIKSGESCDEAAVIQGMRRQEMARRTNDNSQSQSRFNLIKLRGRNSTMNELTHIPRFLTVFSVVDRPDLPSKPPFIVYDILNSVWSSRQLLFHTVLFLLLLLMPRYFFFSFAK